MTCSGPVRPAHRQLDILGDEGLRLFFPLAAVHAALWPLLWAVVHGLSLPFDEALPPTLRHAYEMIFGAFGAALLGFVTTAVPEWSNTERLRGRPLFILCGLWGTGRIAGLLGAPGLAEVGAVADFAWLIALPAYVAWVMARRRLARLFAFLLWLGGLAAAGVTVQAAILMGDAGLAQDALRIAALVFVGLLGVVLARITVPITNIVLDPTRATSPYRPHPGRVNLAPGLVAVAVAGELAGLSAAVSGYLLIAAGAAFLDRVAESFVGREALRAPIIGPAASSFLAGSGLILVGLGRLGAPVAETTALHVILMGGLGLGVLTVFAVASLMHTGRKLVFPPVVPFVFALAVAATAARVLPDLGVLPHPPGPAYALPALLWAAAFLLWLRTYWAFLSQPGVDDDAAP